MPTYDYECRKCKTRFDEVHSIADCAKAIHCPDCGAVAKRAVSVPNFTRNGGDPYDWHKENGGKGRRISQLDYDTDKPFYARSQSDAIENGQRRGLKVIKA